MDAARLLNCMKEIKALQKVVAPMLEKVGRMAEDVATL